MTLSFPVLLLVAALIGVVLAGRRGWSGGRGGSGGPAWWSENHMPWGGADEPFHPRDRDLRDRAYEEAEAGHRGGAGTREARLDERYGGDFGPWPPDGA